MARTSNSTSLRVVLRAGAAVGVVGLITFTCVALLPVNATTVGFAYLVAILFLAARWGLAESIVASVAAVLYFNYFFFPPVGTFTVADPQNWMALFAFLATAIIASRLSAEARNRALEAVERQAEMERLYALSRAILLTEPSQSVPKQVAAEVARVLGVSGVTLYDRETQQFYRSGPEDFPGPDEQLRQAALQGTLFRSADGRTIITAIRLGSQPIASLGIRGVELSDSALHSLANLVAIGLERARAQEAASRAEAARQSEALKSTLMDAIAHEFQTPLTSIKAAATALLSEHPPKPEEQREFITIVDEEASRLSGLVEDTLQMVRVDAGKVQLHRENWPIADLVRGVLEKLRPVLDGRPVEVSVAPGLPPLPADRDLVALALRQLLNNAVKYSAPHTPILVSVSADQGRAVFRIQDRGPGIVEAELSRIFDKFYRTRSASEMPGAGLGLSIARDVALAHGGDIWAESTPGEGSTFFLALPLLAQEAAP